jgi:uncharacterized protein YqeY
MNKQQLLLKLTTAIKSKDEVAKKAFRAVISEIDLAESKEQVSEDRILSIIKKEREKFSQSSEIFLEKSPDLSAEYKKCSELLGEFIPKDIPESEFSFILSSLKSEGSNFGLIMKSAKERHGSTLDMKKFSAFVKQNL